MSSELAKIERVPFHQDAIHCVRDGQREDFRVILKPTCEALGLEYTGQLQRLKRMSWAKLGMIPIPSAGGSQEVVAISIETFGMWLVTIDASRLKDQATRCKIDLYQCEAAKTLRRHFFGPPPAAPGSIAPAGDPTLMMLDIIREGHLRQLATEREVAALGDRTTAVEARVEAAMAGDVEEVSFMSVRGYCRVHGLRFSKGAESIIGTELTRRCKARGVGVGTKPDETWGRVNIYPMAMLEEWRAGLPLSTSKP